MGDLAIGIDLGTTYCCVAVYRDGKVEIIPNSVGTNTTPSYVHIDKDNFVTAGTAAKGKALQDPTTAVYDVKRLIGRRFNDPLVQMDMKMWPFKVFEDEDTHFPRIRLNETSYLPEQISAHVLEYLKQCAEEWLCCPVKKAVITVPAYFNEAQRHATKVAGSMAGLEVLNLLHEPTAAAVTYCYKNKSFETEKTILVFDLGGGTFDVVVMTIKDRKIQIKAIGGNSHLGGQDIDRNLVRHCLQDFKAKNGIDLNSVASGRDKVKVARILRRLKTECEEIKTQLSYNKKSVITLDNLPNDTSLVVKITREEFDKLNDSLFQQCVNSVKAVIKGAKVTPADINEVIMVGGSSRITRLQELIMGIFPNKKPNKTINADETVAYGAAIQAALMTTDCPALKKIFPDMKIRDVVSPTAKGIVRTNRQVDILESTVDKKIRKSILRRSNIVQKRDEIVVKLHIIKNGLTLNNITEVNVGWDYMYDLTDENPDNCRRFLELRGIQVFLICFNAFPSDLHPNDYSLRSLVNVAEVEHLRPQLMTSELINVFFNLLDSTEDNNLVSYIAALFTTLILSDGVVAWTIKSPRRDDVLSGIRRCIQRWEDIYDGYIHWMSYIYSRWNLRLYLRLLNVTHTPECQLFAAWSLKNNTKALRNVNTSIMLKHLSLAEMSCKERLDSAKPEMTEKYVPMLVKEGGLDILNKIKCENEDLRKFVNTVHSRYKSTL